MIISELEKVSKMSTKPQIFTDSDIQTIRRIIEHINISSLNPSLLSHLILVSNATIPITKLVKTACKITG